MNKHLSKKDTQMATWKKDYKKCSWWFTIKKMQTKTKIRRYHLTPVRITNITNITKIGNNQYWQECSDKGSLLHCWWECSSYFHCFIRKFLDLGECWGFSKVVRVHVKHAPNVDLIPDLHNFLSFIRYRPRGLAPEHHLEKGAGSTESFGPSIELLTYLTEYTQEWHLTPSIIWEAPPPNFYLLSSEFSLFPFLLMLLLPIWQLEIICTLFWCIKDYILFWPWPSQWQCQQHLTQHVEWCLRSRTQSLMTIKAGTLPLSNPKAL